MRTSPRGRIGKKVSTLLNQSINSEEAVATLVIRMSVERMAEPMLEQEEIDHPEREPCQDRRPDQEHHGYRNGYELGRPRTAEGKIVFRAPQVRDAPKTHRCQLMTFLRGKTDLKQRLAVEMCARGLTTRAIKIALVEAMGNRL
jgi:transposase-like protein